MLCWQNQQCRSVTIDILRSGTGTAVITYLDLLWRRWNQPRSQLPLQCASTHNTHSCWHQTHPSHGSTSNLLGCPTGAEFTSSVNPQITGLLGQGSDFSPASACGQLTDTDGFPELLEVEATHCKQAEIVAVVVGPMPQYPSCNNIYGGSGLHPANTVCSLYHIPAPSGCIYEPVPVFSSSLSTET